MWRYFVLLLSVGIIFSNCATIAGASAKATGIALRSVDGNTVDIGESIGKKVTLLVFWATWCGPCTHEMPALEAMYQKHKASGLEIYGISMDGPETLSQVESVVRRMQITYPILLDENTQAVAIYNPSKDAPYAVLIDKYGKVVEGKVGYAPGDEIKLEEHIVSLLQAP